MNTQRAAAGIGAFLVLVIGTTLCVVTAGALAGLTGSAAFGVVFKTVLVLALLASTLGAWVSNTPAGPSRGPWCAVEQSDRDLPALAGSGS